MEFADLRVIVTGAARGLGKSAVAFLLQHGAKVGAVDVNADGLSKLQESLEAGTRHGKLYPYVADVSNEEQVKGAIQRANSDLGQVNALVNCAGIYLDGLIVREGGIRFPLSQWRKVIDVDLTGTFLMTREVAAAMLASKTRRGVIINIASIARHGNVGQSPYSAAKAGVVADCRVWARELAPYGIRVAAISPGLIETPILAAMAPTTLKNYIERIPLGRLGKPEEVNAAIRFVIECDYFTGECVEVNGGFLF
jgi:3-oxoacyl-[acyl-carrier protein] reductase